MPLYSTAAAGARSSGTELGAWLGQGRMRGARFRAVPDSVLPGSPRATRGGLQERPAFIHPPQPV